MLFDVHLSKHAKGIFYDEYVFEENLCQSIFFIMKRFPIAKLIKMKNEDIFLTMIKLYL
jgi:hypothetical protein